MNNSMRNKANFKRRKTLGIAALAASMFLTIPAIADDGDNNNKFGLAGLLSGTNKEDLPEIPLSVGVPLGGPWTLKSGTYYEVELVADGSGEIELDIADFSRAVWIDEIVIEGLEIRPYGVQSVEFDDAGTMEIGFVAIKPGMFEIRVPGSTGDSQALQVTIQ